MTSVACFHFLGYSYWHCFQFFIQNCAMFCHPTPSWLFQLRIASIHSWSLSLICGIVLNSRLHFARSGSLCAVAFNIFFLYLPSFCFTRINLAASLRLTLNRLLLSPRLRNAGCLLTQPAPVSYSLLSYFSSHFLLPLKLLFERQRVKELLKMNYLF